MKKFILLYIFIYTSLLGFTQNVASGDIEQLVGNIIENMPPSSGDEFAIPTASEQAIWESCVLKLLDNNVLEANDLANSLGYEVIEFTETSLSDTPLYYVLRRKSDSSNYWGTYIFNPSACRKELIIQSPHPKNDTNTGHQGVFCFKNVNARAFFISGTHRCNSNDFSNCSGTTSTCGSSDAFRISDLPHHTDNVFHLTTKILLNSIPDAVFIQLHGFGKRSTDPYVIMSNGTKHTPSGVDFAIQLKDALVATDNVLTFKIGHLDESWTRLLGATNVQGRMINNSDTPCSNAANTATGQFIHLEQERGRLRDTKNGWQKVATAIENVFDCTIVSSTTQETIFEKPIASISPNPFSNQLMLKLVEPITNFTFLKIYNLQNKLIYQTQIKAQQMNLSISESWPNGMYITLIENKEKAQALKLFKQN